MVVLLSRFLILWLICTVPILGNAEVLLDEDFEVGVQGWRVVSIPAAGEQFVILDQNHQKQGRASLKVEVPHGYRTSLVNDVIKIRPDKDYVLSFWIRSESQQQPGAGVSVGYAVTWFDERRRSLGHANGNVPEISEDRWRLVTHMLHPPKRAVYSQMQFTLQSTDKGALRVWLDAVRIRAGIVQEVRVQEALAEFHVADGKFNQGLFRRVADDDARSGYSVMANPQYVAKPGYLAGNFYIRDIQPGQYRAIFRVKIVAVSGKESRPLHWNINTDSSGVLATGEVGILDDVSEIDYRDIEASFFVPPGVAWIDPRLYWQGGAKAWVDTITIVQEKRFSESEIKALFE